MRLKKQTLKFIEAIGFIIVGVLVGITPALIMGGISYLLKLQRFMWLIPIAYFGVMFYFLWRSCKDD